MSGTSLDGLDIACCIFYREGGRWKFEIEAAEAISYTDEWTNRLQHSPKLDGAGLIRLHKEYGLFLAKSVNEFCAKHNLSPHFIASHGHTVFHDPASGIAFQAGDGAVISAVTRLPVVCDFRSVDVAAGGQGAPLVPVGDKLLFGEYDLCLNLGGIANISYDSTEARIAYDVCPCNLLLDRLAQQAGQQYDKGGEIARKGVVDKSLLSALNACEYYRRQPPKSLDKEALLRELLPLIEASPVSMEDKLATVTLHIAQKTAESVQAAGLRSSSRMLVTGGGAFNTFLVELLKKHCPVAIEVPDEKLVSFKEAMVFAFLGLLRVRNEPNALRSVTGAAYDTVGGALYGDFSTIPM